MVHDMHLLRVKAPERSSGSWDVYDHVATVPGGQAFPVARTASAAAAHPYVGLWVTDDRRVRHALLPNGRYDEARGSRESAYKGRYEVTGTHIEYRDDTGFTADGDFVDADTLHHGGMVLRRQPRA